MTTAVIPLYRGGRHKPLYVVAHTLVDPADLPALSVFTWRLSSYGYAFRMQEKCAVLMHQMLIDVPDGLQCDHINGDRLDNRRANLRVASASDNTCNRGKFAGEFTSQFKGVHYDKKVRRWVAICRRHGRAVRRHCMTELEAARAYDEMAKAMHGEFARLNFGYAEVAA